MRMRSVAVGIAGAILFGICGCVDATAPRARAVLAPTTLRKTVTGPPDVTGSVGAKFADNTALYNFPYETWVTLEVTGFVSFT